MRCTARERLGFTRGACEDAREGVRLAPRAAKLWAKAASLALRIEGCAAGSEGRKVGSDEIEEGATAARLSGAMEVSVVGQNKRLKMGALFLCVSLNLVFVFSRKCGDRVFLRSVVSSSAMFVCFSVTVRVYPLFEICTALVFV